MAYPRDRDDFGRRRLYGHRQPRDHGRRGQLPAPPQRQHRRCCRSTLGGTPTRGLRRGDRNARHRHARSGLRRGLHRDRPHPPVHAAGRGAHRRRRTFGVRTGVVRSGLHHERHRAHRRRRAGARLPRGLRASWWAPRGVRPRLPRPLLVHGRKGRPRAPLPTSWPRRRGHHRAGFVVDRCQYVDSLGSGDAGLQGPREPQGRSRRGVARLLRPGDLPHQPRPRSATGPSRRQEPPPSPPDRSDRRRAVEPGARPVRRPVRDEPARRSSAPAPSVSDSGGTVGGRGRGCALRRRYRCPGPRWVGEAARSAATTPMLRALGLPSSARVARALGAG